MSDETTDVLLDALKRAAEAHGVHEAEELGGVYDAEWPQWYAEHMTRTLSEAGYRLVGPAD
jgi:hypothetical protein